MKKQVPVILIAVIALTLVLAQALAAQESQSPVPAAPLTSSGASSIASVNGLELVSQIGGEVNAVAVQGNYAYYGLGPRLVVLNISDPAHTFVVGRTDVLSSTVNDVVVVGNTAYAAGNDGLFIINIADPTHPALAGIAASPFGTWYDAVTVAGQTAYLAAAGGTESGLYLVDVTNPAAPSDLGHYFTSDIGNGVAVVGHYAYLADESGLRVIDVLTPGAPSLAGSYPMSDTRSVAVSGTYAYVGDLPGVFTILNIGNPASISPVGSVNPGGGTIPDITLVGNTAYLAAGGQLSIVNVATHSNPVVVGHINSRNNHFASAVTVAGSYAYLAESSGGLSIINVSVPATPSEVGFQASMGDAFDVAVASGYAYVPGDWTDGLHIVNVSTAAAPSEVGAFSTGSNSILGVAVAGNTAYLGEADGLRIVNVANRSQPVQAGFLSTPANVSRVAVNGTTAYLANQSRGLRIIDISNPALPNEVGHVDMPGFATDVAISGTYAYVADGDQGLRIVDITIPSAPHESGVYTSTGYTDIEGVAVVGHYAYLAGGSTGLRIVDIANAAHPVEVGSASVMGSADRVAVAGNYAYVAENNLRIFNVSSPAHPFETASFETPGPAARLAVVGNYVYVATQNSGLLTLWFTPPVTASIPGAGGSLMSVQDNTAYTFPSGAFAGTALVTHTPRFPGNAPLPPANQIGIGHVFEITATLPIVAGHSYTLTVTYADAEKGPAIEDTLALYYWNGSTWIQESSIVNTGANTVTATPNHFSLWAVFGHTNQVFLPLVMKN